MIDQISRSEVEQEIKETFGLVPSFFKNIPDETFAHEWAIFKHWELEDTLIPAKYKELMMLAVHSETRCRYCTLFHTEMARLHGATDDEIAEAVNVAKYTVSWSVYLNGIREDYDRFERELEQVGEHLQEEEGVAA